MPKMDQITIDRTYFYYGDEMIRYIQDRNKRHPHDKTTLSHICKRFRLIQEDAKEIINKHPGLILSHLAYKPAGPNPGFAEAMLSSWFPTEWDKAPDGRRLVFVLTGDQIK